MKSFWLAILVALSTAGSAAADPPTSKPKGTKMEMPPDMESHTLVLLVRGPKAAAFTEAELEKLQAQHLAHLDKLARTGKILVVGPFADPTDETLRGGCIYSVPLAEAVQLAEQDRW